MSKSNKDILFNRRELKILQKQGYEYLTFDVSVTSWKKKPYFVSANNCNRTSEENIRNGLWICVSPTAGINKISAISGIEEPWAHLYSIEKLLEIVPNSEQI